MHTYYVSGLPYSDELYHHGVKGMHWGVRLYQNPDGTLTPLGKIHYGASKAAKGVGSAVVNTSRTIKKATDKIVDHEVDKIKRKHIWLMSNEELEAHTKRLNTETAYREAAKKLKEQSKGRRVAMDILETAGKTIAKNVIDRAMNEAEFKEKLSRDIKYSKKMAKRAAKNKVYQDRYINRKQDRQQRKLASGRLYDKIQQNPQYYSNKSLDVALKRLDTLRRMENRYRGSNIQNYSYNSNDNKKKG